METPNIELSDYIKESTMRKRLGIIGGSGLYEITGVDNKRITFKLDTPWGDPLHQYS